MTVVIAFDIFLRTNVRFPCLIFSDDVCFFLMACVEDLQLTWRYIASVDQGVGFDCVHVS